VKYLLKVTKGLVLISLSVSVMGAQSCKEEETPVVRQLRRRVQLGKIQAPPIELPPSYGSKKFDFAYVANMQMYDILRKTQSFSTANVDPNQVFDPADLNDDAKTDFNNCSDDDQEMQVFSGNGQKLNGKVTFSKSAACMIDMPQAVISGAILDFQLTNGGGLSLGLANVKFLQALDFSFERYQLDVTLLAKSPMEIGDHYFSTTVKKSFGNKFGASVGLNFGTITLGPKYYMQSPLSKVVDDGLTQAVNELKNNWSADDPWYAMVLKACDKFIYINGGYGNDAGLKVGDILRVQNVTYEWQDRACHSQLRGEMALNPVAYVKVISVGRNLAAGEIIERDPQYPHLPDRIYPGSRVYLEKTVEQVQAEQAKASQKASRK
jgi:hypothetical protein